MWTARIKLVVLQHQLLFKMQQVAAQDLRAGVERYEQSVDAEYETKVLPHQLFLTLTPCCVRRTASITLHHSIYCCPPTSHTSHTFATRPHSPSAACAAPPASPSTTTSTAASHLPHFPHTSTLTPCCVRRTASMTLHHSCSRRMVRRKRLTAMVAGPLLDLVISCCHAIQGHEEETKHLMPLCMMRCRVATAMVAGPLRDLVISCCSAEKGNVE